MVTPYVYSQLYSPIVRLRVTADEPAEGPPAILERPRGSRQPHTDLTVAKVRHLVENTVLNYREIAAKTGTTNCAVSRWTRDGGWQRPPGAPRANDMMPNWRAGRRLKLRKLAGRLQEIAERYGRELEETPGVDLNKLIEALQVLRMARLEVMGNRGRRRPWLGPVVSGAWKAELDKAIYTALKQMRRGGVDLDRAPKEAVDMVIEANTPVEDVGKIRMPRGGRRKRDT
jgi:sirohydrochlorin ferrochelatase